MMKARADQARQIKTRMSKSIDPKTRYASIIAPPSLEQISVIIPVKDNPMGVARAAASFLNLPPNCRPSEIIVVDNNSSPPLNLDASRLPRRN